MSIEKKISNNHKIAKNTLILYIRQILIIVVSLYTVRIVLRILGVEDYGIFNVVGGVVSMFGFLSSAMANASQRFFAFDLGRKDNDNLQKTFSLSVIIYLLITILILIVAETLGLWFLKNKLIYPVERILAVNWVFQCSIISFLITMLNTPYLAMVIAHENMEAYAWVSIIEVILKLILIFLLQLFDVDKLKLYSFLLLLISIFRFMAFYGISRKRYKECKFKLFLEKKSFFEMISYVGWSFIRPFSTVLKGQGVNILLNMFFGPVVNASRGIAFQVNSAINSFSSNFLMAIQPQIVKLYARDDKEGMLLLVFRGAKMTAYLMLFFILPLAFEMPVVINLWLGQIPEYVIWFTRLILIDALIDSIIQPIQSAVQATGKIKLYEIITGILISLNFPVSFVVLKFGASPYSVFIVAIFVTIIADIVRLYIAKVQLSFLFFLFIKKVIIPVFFVFLITSLTLFVCSITLDAGVIRLIVSIFLSSFTTSVAIYYIGLTFDERKYVTDIFRTKILKNH